MALITTKLTGATTFPLWEQGMTVFLTAQDLIGYVDGTVTEDSGEAEWKLKNAKVSRYILTTISEHVKAQERIFECKTAREMFTTLCKAYKKDSQDEPKRNAGGSKQCNTCKKPGHVEEECWGTKTFPPCKYCKKTNHPQEYCRFKSQNNNEKMGKKTETWPPCKYCKKTNHPQENCRFKSQNNNEKIDKKNIYQPQDPSRFKDGQDKDKISKKIEINKQNNIKNNLGRGTSVPLETEHSEAAGSSVDEQPQNSKKSSSWNFLNNNNLTLKLW